ncbi:hypothetical protein E9993_05850 [Labilibacter sediminis]|nr:hypothetical protein E9993_05850 [Labilibacter sediminis]
MRLVNINIVEVIYFIHLNLFESPMKTTLILISISLTLFVYVGCSKDKKGRVKIPYEPPVKLTEYVNNLDTALQKTLLASNEDMQWWKDAQFGFFIHWNPSSVMDIGPISWKRFGPRPGHGKKATDGIPLEVYDNLYKQFNPVSFNAEEWIQIVKESGAKYLIFTTKHHDGFCMFDSKVTDYDIMSSPFGRDVCKEIADACHKHGIKLFWYYSQPDWHHPDYFAGNHEKYVRDYLYVQIRELLTNYGKIDGMWFDGLGKHPETWHTPEMLKMVRELQPGIIVNHRIGPRDWRMGDFDGPEREIGHFQINRPWETCTTIGGTWGWGGDVDPMSYNSAIHLLLNCAGNGGNLALNTGPNSKGIINPKHAKRYREIGTWLNKYGESVYGTEGGPYMSGPWGVCTQKKGKVYLHLLASWNGGNITFPPLSIKVNKARLLTGGNVHFHQDNQGLYLTIDKKYLNPLNTIVELSVADHSGLILSIATMPKDTITIGAEVLASSGQESAGNLVVLEAKEFSEGAFVKSKWKTDRKDLNPCLILKLKNENIFKQILIKSKDSNIRSYDIDIFNGEKWVNIFKGNELSDITGIILDKPVKSSQLRFQFYSSKGQLQISSINLFNY